MREGQKTFTARRLRRDETFAEKRLWEQLRNRQLAGVKFVRQAPIGPYITDFLGREHKLIVEIDGATHSTDAEVSHDAVRTAQLARMGFSMLRLQNGEVIDGMDEVLTLIREALARCPSPSPSHGDGSPSSPASGRGHEEDFS